MAEESNTFSNGRGKQNTFHIPKTGIEIIITGNLSDM